MQKWQWGIGLLAWILTGCAAQHQKTVLGEAGVGHTGAVKETHLSASTRPKLEMLDMFVYPQQVGEEGYWVKVSVNKVDRKVVDDK